jgi:hypothetical protein
MRQQRIFLSVSERRRRRRARRVAILVLVVGALGVPAMAVKTLGSG